MVSTLSVEDRIIRAKVSIRERHPFFSYLLLHLTIKENNNIPTCCVNRDGLMQYNSKWFETLTDEELLGVIIHEILHVVYLHLVRGQKKDHYVFNIAADAAINNILINNRFELPKAGVLPVNNVLTIVQRRSTIIVKELDKKFAELIYDEIYSKIEREKGNGKGPKGEPSDDEGKEGGGGESSDDEDQNDGKGKGKPKKFKPKDNGEIPQGFDEHDYSGDEEKNEATEQKWKERIVDALNVAKQQGKVPAGMEHMVGELLQEKINWRTFLYRFITNMLPHDYTWKKPMKKSYALGVYFPEVERECLEVVVAIDTSGSLSQNELRDFLSEVVGIAKSFANVHITIIECDCRIQQVLEVKNGDIPKIMEMKMIGGGGTSHKPVFSYIEKHIPSCKVLVCLTDGFSDIQFIEEPQYPVLWVLSQNSVPEKDIPFGTTIKM
jgi:predicted metal-dependent peptidase